ncbi:AAA ATPase central domain protein [Caldithrix abyssi DSM 13497]|uniref:Replication-associated recombination protein A n=1 Tax=Caldithrix abyssi DSM 13497 TaxID=880073 RepID=H1XT15_CALAY|nr:replication-associated recombination protein A [Caldithrix abyssi]APF17327.1 Recombination protein MgsA [Caldithrix abyssi DSM 13497]EHO41444.1 AAA ATPase central domain protein [Caldithrix abyssi DSM 13497]
MKKQTGNLFDSKTNDPLQRPLAERVRPQSLDEVVGHEKIIGPQSTLRKQIASGYLPSMIFWGPPGVGKTTLARLLARELKYRFVSISAVTSGVKEVKQIIEEARSQRRYYNQATVLFIDEIHRFNKAQQDALLHAVEDGTLILMGATTENPSFEVIAPLLSRCQVIQLNELSASDLKTIVQRAMEKDVLLQQYDIDLQGFDALLAFGAGDARRTLNLLEMTFHLAEKDGKKVIITEELVKQAVDQSPLYYDKHGDYHYDTISAFIKSVRGSDPDAAVYYLAVMLEAGEDPVFIARRLIVLASEDIGNAEPYALMLANTAFEAVKKIGMPEARIILAQVTTYLASVPKSNAAYLAINRAQEVVRKKGPKSVPLHLRNAPTGLMKDLKYGVGYKYPHDFPGHFVRQNYLPQGLEDELFYEPASTGREARLKQYLEQLWEKRKGKDID